MSSLYAPRTLRTPVNLQQINYESRPVSARSIAATTSSGRKSNASTFSTAKTGSLASFETAREYLEFSELEEAIEQHGISERLDWSGRGQHIEYRMEDELPFDIEPTSIGKGATAVIDVVRCRRLRLARKSIQCNREIKLKDVIGEVKMLQKLQDTHIIQLVGSYVQGRVCALLLYPVADCNLKDFLENIEDGFYPANFRRSLWAKSACLIHALAVIHRNDIKHLDIKPANVLVKQTFSVEKFRLYITDFGISKQFADESQTDNPAWFTPRYCSPEVADEDFKGRASDIFSLGCTLVEILTLATQRSLGELDDCLSEGRGKCYHRNIDSVISWLQKLEEMPHFPREAAQPVQLSRPLFSENHSGFSIITQSLGKMLNEKPKARPTANELSRVFHHNTCCDFGPEPYRTIGQDLENAAKADAWDMVKGAVQNRLCLKNEPDAVTKLIGMAFLSGEYEVVSLLLPQLPLGFLHNKTGFHWLTMALRDKQNQMVLDLLANTDLKLSDLQLVEAFFFAMCQHDLPSCAHILAYNRKCFEQKDAAALLLTEACDIGYMDIVQLLLRAAKANLLSQWDQSFVPLHRAIIRGDSEIVDILLQSGANTQYLSIVGEVALPHAQTGMAVYPAIQNTGTFFQLGVPSMRRSSCQTIPPADTKMVKLLLRHGVNVDGKQQVYDLKPSYIVLRGVVGAERRSAGGFTALHLAVAFNEMSLAIATLDGGVDINAKARLGKTALHMAVEGANASLVELLLVRKADTEALTLAGGETALHLAIRCNLIAAARLLLQHGANSEAKCVITRSTPLHYAAKRANKALVCLLLDQKAAVDSTTVLGSTPLHEAAEGGHYEVIDVLVSNGADVLALDLRARTPLDLAKQSGHVLGIRHLHSWMVRRWNQDFALPRPQDEKAGRVSPFVNDRTSRDLLERCLLDDESLYCLDWIQNGQLNGNKRFCQIINSSYIPNEGIESKDLAVEVEDEIVKRGLSDSADDHNNGSLEKPAECIADGPMYTADGFIG
ncbi:MAG: hypothetical protein M1814_001412 [Vezdaea aestivalis]|nr:MAG: hypothetical protein M1814_001412 [Vezdaea aestivalis]